VGLTRGGLGGGGLGEDDVVRAEEEVAFDGEVVVLAEHEVVLLSVWDRARRGDAVVVVPS
jgi:hypothetical protein